MNPSFFLREIMVLDQHTASFSLWGHNSLGTFSLRGGHVTSAQQRVGGNTGLISLSNPPRCLSSLPMNEEDSQGFSTGSAPWPFHSPVLGTTVNVWRHFWMSHKRSAASIYCLRPREPNIIHSTDQPCHMKDQSDKEKPHPMGPSSGGAC